MTDDELISAVAEEVMGWKQYTMSHGFYHVGPQYGLDSSRKEVAYDDTWNPLTNANHWIMMVERMIDLGWFVELSWLGGSPDGWRARFHKLAPTDNNFYAYDDKIGRAICLAALRLMRR